MSWRSTSRAPGRAGSPRRGVLYVCRQRVFMLARRASHGCRLRTPRGGVVLGRLRRWLRLHAGRAVPVGKLDDGCPVREVHSRRDGQHVRSGRGAGDVRLSDWATLRRRSVHIMCAGSVYVRTRHGCRWVGVRFSRLAWVLGMCSSPLSQRHVVHPGAHVHMRQRARCRRCAVPVGRRSGMSRLQHRL